MRLVKIWFVLFFLAMVIVPKCVYSEGMIVIASGKYRFLVDVSTQTNQAAYGVEGRLTISGNIARIDVEGPGYLPDYCEIKLKDGEYVYSTYFRLKDPDTSMSMVDLNSNTIAGCTFSNDVPENLYYGGNYGFTGMFPKAGFEKLNACNFKLYINDQEIISLVPRVYLSPRGDNWHLEVVVPRTNLNITCNNHFKLVVFQCLQTQPGAACLTELASDYTHNLELISSLRDEESVLIVQGRLESNAGILNEYFSSIDTEEQKNILGYLPSEGDLVRSLKSIAAFAELHR